MLNPVMANLISSKDEVNAQKGKWGVRNESKEGPTEECQVPKRKTIEIKKFSGG